MFDLSITLASLLDWLVPIKRTTSIPGTKLQHHKLGWVQFEDEGWWRGKTTIDSYEIEFYVYDMGSGIDENLAEYCIVVLTNFSHYLRQANEMFSSELSIAADEVRKRFTPTHIWSFWIENHKKLFLLSFADSEDEFALWRVQFDNDKATYLGCDT